MRHFREWQQQRMKERRHYIVTTRRLLQADYKETMKRSGKLFNQYYKLSQKIERNPFSITLRFKRHRAHKLYNVAHNEFIAAASKRNVFNDAVRQSDEELKNRKRNQ